MVVTQHGSRGRKRQSFPHMKISRYTRVQSPSCFKLPDPPLITSHIRDKSVPHKSKKWPPNTSIMCTWSFMQIAIQTAFGFLPTVYPSDLLACPPFLHLASQFWPKWDSQLPSDGPSSPPHQLNNLSGSAVPPAPTFHPCRRWGTPLCSPPTALSPRKPADRGPRSPIHRAHS